MFAALTLSSVLGAAVHLPAPTTVHPERLAHVRTRTHTQAMGTGPKLGTLAIAACPMSAFVPRNTASSGQKTMVAKVEPMRRAYALHRRGGKRCVLSVLSASRAGLMRDAWRVITDVGGI
jgi:hypothetical protein